MDFSLFNCESRRRDGSAAALGELLAKRREEEREEGEQTERDMC